MTDAEAKEYVKKIPQTVSEFDTVRYTEEMHDGQLIKGLLFYKMFPDGTMRSYLMVSNRKGTLTTKTTYMEKADFVQNKKKSSLLPDVQAPSLTSETKSSSTSNKMIPTKEDVVNKKQSKEYTKKGNNVNKTKYSLSDTQGRSLSKSQQEYFKDSKVRDEDGNLRVVYHGSSEDFTVFDRTKARANMDIQGNFFSPWDLDAQGYGENVRAFYLNITNPAPEDIAYKALNKFKGQNGAGIKAREYLESLGYDGVNNGDEEYITFYPHQIKSTDNGNPTDNPDINLSLSKPGEDIPADGYAVYGRDVKLQEEIAPIREDSTRPTRK